LERWWEDADRGKPKNWVEEPASVSHDDDDDDYVVVVMGRRRRGCGKWRCKFVKIF